MCKLPTKIKLTHHARVRLDERNELDVRYNTNNLMRSSCKWYGKDDFIENSLLYLHYINECSRSKNIGYITDGNIEVIYNKNTKTAITILKMDDKYIPISKFIKPIVLEQIRAKRETKKLKKVVIEKPQIVKNEYTKRYSDEIFSDRFFETVYS